MASSHATANFNQKGVDSGVICFAIEEEKDRPLVIVDDNAVEIVKDYEEDEKKYSEDASLHNRSTTTSKLAMLCMNNETSRDPVALERFNIFEKPMIPSRGQQVKKM